MARWNIRQATIHDAVALKSCIDAAYAGYRKRISDLPPVSEGLADDIEYNVAWVAELDHSVVGGLILILGDGDAMLVNIAVDPDCSGRGISRGLIEHAEAHCRTQKKSELHLSTHVAMPENISLYEHLGWEENG